jgi:DHA1 family tetracycline resistance protein-like MFS transporter
VTDDDGLERPGAARTAAFIFIFITVALDMIALGIIVPVLPKLIVQFEGGDIARAAAITGVFGTVWALMQFLFAPVLGALSDRLGRRPVILLSNVGLGLDYLMMALAPTLPWLFVGRVISGITSASYPTAGAYIADVTPPEQRAARFGMLGAAFGLGFIVGPALGGWLGNVDLRLPFWVAGALSLVNAAYGFFILPESLPRERRAAFSWKRASSFGSFVLLRSHPELLVLAGAGFLSYLAHESLPSVFVLYTDYRYRWTAGMVGTALATIGVCSTIVSASLIGPIVKRLGARRALLAGYAFGLIAFAVFGLAPTGRVLLAGLPFVSLWAIANASMQSLMSRRVSPREQGQLQGAIGSLRGVSGLVGPVLFTQTFAAAIRDSSIPGAPYLLASALLGLAIMLSWRATRAGAEPA